MDEASVDLIRLEGEGNSVILRLTDRERHGASDVLVGQVLVDTPFVRGSLKIWVFSNELPQWQEALDALDAGDNIGWREEKRGPELFIDRDVENERARVTIRDTAMSLTTVTVTVPLVDEWFDDAYRRLNLTWETFDLK
ncbi:DUF5959 family protein [Streptomyces sp. JJ36]|uniref:DUF5959 family protein n=1 Tax=Streptomyces sp. JJ36 TaxID=2736645 RepID=UPI001F1F47F5|nr:DUF5959 family protein [Streptomyces sp. JJ36]MCF6525009.1 hypothetical protein [Streptomyces sp. JJ36]